VTNMPGNTKAIVSDVNAKPAPQIFDPSKDAYDYLLGQNGAMRTLLYDASGNPLLTQANPGYADLVDRAARVLGKISADDGAIAALGALAAAAITDPAQNASVIALLKGILKQLQGTGTGAAPVQLTGSNIQQVDVLPRQIRAAGDHTFTIQNDKGYSKCIVVLDIYGVTGAFGSNEGIRLGCYTQPTGRSYGNRGITAVTDRTKNSLEIVHQIQIALGAHESPNTDPYSKAKGISAIPAPSVRGYVGINGTFASGEGFDCAVKAYWIP